MKDSYSAGGIIRNSAGDILLIHEGNDFWGFPKGHIEEGEDALIAARREIEEEAGLFNLIYISKLGTYKRHPYNHGTENTSELKHITLFLFATEEDPAKTNVEGNGWMWCKPDEAVKHLQHPLDREFFLKHIDEITA